MKLILSFFIVLLPFAVGSAQKPDDVLATTSLRPFTKQDLSPDTQKLFENQNTVVANARTRLLVQIQQDALLEAEAKAKNVTAESLAAAEKAKIAEPSEAEIKTVYDANREAIKDKTLAEVRKQIVEFLRNEPEQAAIKKYVDALAAKYKVLPGKDVNAPDLKSADILLTVAGRPIMAKEYDDKFKLVLYDVRADILDQIKEDIENSVYLALVGEEAKSQNIDSSTLIAREITNKLREFSDEERLGLDDAFKKRLFGKYNVKFLLKYPEPFVQNISTGDGPARGPATAPVKVVMFSDFQCPACSATHPVLQKVLAEYGEKIRFVVRDFPLVSIHENAFRAALAAGAAGAQGKFFEYSELLYKNQSALDTASLSKYAASLGLNVKRFELDLSSEKTAAEVQKDIADGKSYGITGTPTIFVNGVKVRHLSVDGFREAIDAALKRQ